MEVHHHIVKKCRHWLEPNVWADKQYKDAICKYLLVGQATMLHDMFFRSLCLDDFPLMHYSLVTCMSWCIKSLVTLNSLMLSYFKLTSKKRAKLNNFYLAFVVHIIPYYSQAISKWHPVYAYRQRDNPTWHTPMTLIWLALMPRVSQFAICRVIIYDACLSILAQTAVSPLLMHWIC